MGPGQRSQPGRALQHTQLQCAAAGKSAGLLSAAIRQLNTSKIFAVLGGITHRLSIVSRWEYKGTTIVSRWEYKGTTIVSTLSRGIFSGSRRYESHHRNNFCFSYPDCGHCRGLLSTWPVARDSHSGE